MENAVQGGTAAVILAGGKSKRMMTDLPKAMHKVGGTPMVGMVLGAVRRSGAERVVVVVGFGAEAVKNYLGDSVEYAVQKEQKGTGHALLTGLDYLAAGGYKGRALVAYGDMPLVSDKTLSALTAQNAANGEAGTLAYAELENPCSYAYGRIVRDSRGGFIKIVEQKDATEEQKRIKASNIGVYCFDAEAARTALGKVEPNNAQGEIYLTDAFPHLAAAGGKIGLYKIEDADECAGVNDRSALAELNRMVRVKKCAELMLESGVTIIDPAATYIDACVIVGMDTTIYPGCVIEGEAIIGDRCVIGPNCMFSGKPVISDGCRIGPNSALSGNPVLRDGCEIGSNCVIRGNVVLGKGCSLGPGCVIEGDAIIDAGSALAPYAHIGGGSV